MCRLYKNLKIVALPILLIGVIYLTACSNQAPSTTTEPLSRNTFVLGTVVTTTLYDHQSEKLLDQVDEKLQTLEDTLSINKTGTLIDEINLNAGKSPVPVDTATYNLIEKGLYYSELTHGSFDITVGPIVKLWNIGFPEARIPSEEEINAKRNLVGYENVVLNKDSQTVYLTKEGMMLDLGGIGKGYAADEVTTLLKDAGVEHAIINLGGNIYTLGDKPGDQPWTIGVQDPFNPRGKTIGTIKVKNKSVVTSGIYERYIEDESGKQYHHILSPKTGYPYENEIAGVTIISDTSTDGDALSTAIFSMGIEEGLKFVESLDGIDAIFVSTDSKVYVSSDIKEHFNLTSPAFTLINNN